jgi:purine nucleosidase
MPRKIIIDCDPGHDDAMNLLLAFASPELEVLGITTTHGNVGLERTAHNALTIAELAGSSVPVFAGADRPLLRDPIHAEHVHGKSGLEGPILPQPTRALEGQRAAEFIIETVLANPHQVTLVPTGPLTNLALAFRLEPKIIPLIPELIVMGGSTDFGNFSPAAEFNILCDPHAAHIVYSSGIPLVMFGLNVTHQVLATPPRVEQFRALHTRVGDVMVALLEFFKKSYETRYQFAGPALHDPCTVAYLLRPEIFELQAMYVEVELSPGPSFGSTVCDVWSVTGKTPNSRVAVQANADLFFEVLLERISRYF